MRRTLLVLGIFVDLLFPIGARSQSLPTPRPLTVVLYPFIPEYSTVQAELKKGFETLHPDIVLNFPDLTSNYYDSTKANYIGTTKADVYELDSVFLKEFVKNGLVKQWPPNVLLPEDQLVRNAAAGSKVEGIRYGAAHWLCGNFIFFNKTDAAFSNVKRLSDLEKLIGVSNRPAGRGLAVDMKGKSTLGEFDLETAFDHYGNWQQAYQHLSSIDPVLEYDLVRLINLCDPGMCRNGDYHSNDPEIYARLFDDQKARILVGYSEGLHPALVESAQCKPGIQCLKDSDIDVAGFPSDDNGRHQMSWVDSYVLDRGSDQQRTADAVAFVQYMQSDEVYKMILLHSGVAPAYLLPAKASLYQDAEVIHTAHLYPQLKTLIEDAEVPSEVGLNNELRARGAELDRQLSCNP
jgi:thiamine pyridinylase